MSNTVSPELIGLAEILADWAAPATGTVIYLYGSRVRGDHKADSDVDIVVQWPNPNFADTEWWTKNDNESFATINTKLGCRLEVLEHNDPLRSKVFAASVVHQDRNVRCVFLPPKQ
jgi:predicted nucleotidyltransferase